MDEIEYLRGESKTKICITQSLLKNEKVIQNANSKIHYVNTKMHTNSEIIHPFFIPKMIEFASPVNKYISALNCYQTSQKKSPKLTKFHQQKSSMSTLTRITILKGRLPRHQK